MDGFMSKDIHAIGIKRKREYSPSRRESDYKGSSLGPYRGAGNAVTPNGTKVDRYVSRDFGSSQNGVRSHDYYRPEKYIPTGPRTLGRERYRGTESRKSSAFEAPTIEQRVSTSRRTPSPQEGHDGNAQQRPRATEVMEKTSKLVPTDTASNRVERKSFSSICSLDTQANYLKKSVSLTKEAGYNSINALKKDKIVENLQWEYAKRDKFSPIESVSTADDERNRDPPLPRSKSYSKKNKEGPFDLPTSPNRILECSPFDAEQNVTSSRQITGIETIDKKKHSGHMVHAADQLPVPAVDHTCLPVPIHVQNFIQSSLNTVHPSMPCPLPISSPFPPEGNSLPMAHLETRTVRNCSPLSTSAMSISSGSSPARSPPRDSIRSSIRSSVWSPVQSQISHVGTNSLQYSPSRSSVSSRGKRAPTCIVCKGSAALPLKQLVRCTICKHDYHTHCHNPKITMTSGKLDVSVESWICSRCTKKGLPSPKITTVGMKRVGGSVTPKYGFSNTISPLHKRRKVNTEDTIIHHQLNNGKHILKNRNSSMVAPAPSSDTESAVMPEDSAKRKLLPGTQVVPANGAKLLDSQTIIQDCQSNENLSSPISQEAGGNIDKTTVPDDQMVKVLHVSPKTLGHDLRIPIKSRHPDSIQPPINEHDLIGEADDEEAPMDLDSDAGISRPCSPVGEHHTSEPINAATNKPHGISLSSGSHDNSRNLHDDNKTQAPLVHKSNISDNMASEDSSPPYSPRLECDSLPDFPTTETPGKPTERESIGILETETTPLPMQEHSLAIPTQDLSQSSLLSLPLPLVMTQAILGPTTNVPCINCRGNFPIFVNTIKPDGQNQVCSTNCLLQYQALAGKSPKAGMPGERLTEEYRVYSQKSTEAPLFRNPVSVITHSSLKSRSDSEPLPNSIAKITRPKINTANHQSTVDNTETPPELPQRRIKTRQELVEEKYQMQKEIFLPSLRIPQNKDIGKLIEEKTASAATVSIREKAENKEGPKKKLTIEEYTMKKKEKEKGVNPKATAISTDNEEVGKNSDNPGSKKSQEPLPVPDNELTKSTTESRDNGSLKPRPVAATADQATKIPVERGQALHDEEKLKQEVVLWKKKFEEQKGFVQNYVRHNNKMMDKLAEAEKRASELQKMIAALEAKNQASEIKQSQLEAENEDLKQQRVRQEEEQSQCVATEKAEVAIGASKTSELADLMEKNDSAEKDAGVVLLKDVYNHLTFDIDDPLRDMIGAPPSITAPAVLPTPRYSLSRKSEVLNFNSTNLYKLHLHREIDRGTTSVTGFAVVTSEKAARGNTTSAETVEGKTMTFEEFARIPQNLVPVVKDGVLAFRNGQLHPRTRRLERNVPHYKVGRDVPGELRGVR